MKRTPFRLKQQLSPLAAKKKAERDKRSAMTKKRKDRKNPNHVFYCEVLWRGRDKTEWVLQGRLQRVEGI